MEPTRKRAAHFNRYQSSAIMKWSKLKSLVEARFAPSVKKRLAINSTRYGNCTCGRAWITLDGKEIANFCTRAYHLVEGGYVDPATRRTNETLVDFGELSRQNAYESCWAFVHDLSIEDALQDSDPLIQTLAVLDSRLGKRRISQIDIETLHPLARRLFEVRAEAERNIEKD